MNKFTNEQLEAIVNDKPAEVRGGLVEGCHAHQRKDLAAVLLAERKAREVEVGELRAKLNTPEVDDFAQAVVSEAQHQRDRWGSEHDAGKKPLDWFWLIGYLAQKAAEAAMKGDAFKAKHHTISTAAALANWHAALNGHSNSMRPGIEPPTLERTAQ